MNREYDQSHQKPLSGRACVAVGIGFIAFLVVAVELAIISWIRKRYMDTRLLSAVFQVVVGGVLVFLAGWLIGAG